MLASAGQRLVRCQRAWVEDERGKPIGRARSGDRIVIAAIYEISDDSDEPSSALP